MDGEKESLAVSRRLQEPHNVYIQVVLIAAEINVLEFGNIFYSILPEVREVSCANELLLVSSPLCILYSTQSNTKSADASNGKIIF